MMKLIAGLRSRSGEGYRLPSDFEIMELGPSAPTTTDAESELGPDFDLILRLLEEDLLVTEERRYVSHPASNALLARYWSNLVRSIILVSNLNSTTWPWGEISWVRDVSFVTRSFGTLLRCSSLGDRGKISNNSCGLGRSSPQ